MGVPMPTPVPRDAPRRSALVDLTPLRVSRPFAKLWWGMAISGIGSQLTVIAIEIQVYDITRSTFAVALVGGIALVPMIVFGLYAGMLSDAFNRRTVLIWSASISWSSTVVLAALTWTHIAIVWPLYVLAAVNAVATNAAGSTRGAILPRLLPASLLPAAAALNGISFGVMLTVGPTLAGVLIATVGFAWTYTVDVILFVAAFVGILSLPQLRPLGEVVRPGLESLREGVAFLRRAPNIRMSFIVDIVAMTFGRPQVLFPAIGALAIGGGPVTVGILVAAGAVGTLVSSLFSGRLGGVRRHGVAIGWSIAVYGGCVVGFGVVIAAALVGRPNALASGFVPVKLVALAAAVGFLAGTGASDNVSAIFRSTILQTAAPDDMRGRLQGIFMVVVSGGPRLGDMFMGTLAAVTALWFPPVIGGMLVIVVVGALLRFQTTFRHYDALNPTS